MTFTQLIKHTEFSSVQIYIASDKNAQFFAVSTCDSPSQEIVPETLYICYPQQFPAKFPDTDAIFHFLILGSSEDLYCTVPENKINLSFLRTSSGINTLVKAAGYCLRYDLKVSTTLNLLTEALFANKGLQHLLEAAYTIFRNPVAVISSSGKPIAYMPDKKKMEPTDTLTRFLNEEPMINDTPAFSLHMPYPMNFGSLDNPEDICQFYNEAFHAKEIVTLIRVKGVLVASVFVLAKYHDFDELDSMCLQRLAYLIGQEFQKNSLFLQNKNEQKAFFLYCLLKEPSPNVAALMHYLPTTGVRLKEIFYIVVIKNSSYKGSGSAGLFEMIAEQMKSILSGSFYMISDNELIILFNFYRNQSIDDAIREKLRDLAVMSRLDVGISNSFTDLRETQAHYRQAIRAIQNNSRFRRWDVANFSQIAPIEMLHILQEHSDLLSFCCPELLTLLNYDKEHHSNLATTLHYYLESFGNTAEAAAQLFIHKNTLFYRLTKIKEIIHNDLTNGEDVYRFMMSFRILCTLGIYKSPILSPLRMPQE